MHGAVDDQDWVSVSEIADRYKCTRQNVSKRVKGFREANRLQVKGAGRGLRVHLPSYAALVAETHDPAQDLRNRNVKRPADDEPAAPNEKKHAGQPHFNDAAAREKSAKAELAELQLAQKRSELVPVREIERAAVETGTSIAQIVNALKAQSGKLYAASKGGEEALHIELLGIANAMLGSIAESMAKLAARGATEAD
ncbi:hypothetical protein [Methylocystis parvus]|uniref:hypothetical protein n=1 Tax=Methylocystis parvus TaxID=134 RepID=UPI003C7639B5